ncbi:hypothetical protein JQS43_24100 [Natronosporangium hydrolyticum]|uniref:Uncharacterized protein n=1 Tax=Natronosporangium hydrolyticum TaxID=2811111 RepID=A0A895YJ08_9ACTN|nr:hypothetical protein JQS43_24100 [Natronosporangium hydrolyticum]
MTPVDRLFSAALAGFAGVLAIGLVFGAQTAGVGVLRFPYAVVVFGVQALFVIAVTLALRPPAPAPLVLVGLVVSLVADIAAVAPGEADITPLLYLAVLGLVAGLAAQLCFREGRLRLTESLTSSSVVVLGGLGYASLIVLTRLPIGTQALTICLVAAGLALVVSRLADTVAPWPRLAPQVPRGATGVVLGAMLGTAAAAYLGGYIRGFDPGNAALIGLLAAVAAVLADVSVGYAEAGRRTPGAPATLWVARQLQGPLCGFAVAAPVAYLLSALFFVPRYL